MKKMKKWIALTSLFAIACPSWSQDATTAFKGKIFNEEYKVWIEMNFTEKNILVPQQEIFGEVPGYIGSEKDSRKWMIVESEVQDKTATLSIINDYGSEDLQATLTATTDTTFTLTQKEGSTIKFAVNRKWQKLPKQLIFKKKK